MKLPFKLLVLLMAGWRAASAASGPTNSASTNRILVIDPSLMSIAGGKATLTIGALHRTNGVYSGNYRINVSPYFFKNEGGRLAIIVSDESLATISHGKVATIIGTATTSGKGGASRHIDATATPADIDHGVLKLWFTSGTRKMIFEPAYHFAGNESGAIPAQTNNPRPAVKLRSRVSPSHREALEAAAVFP